jgi:hypothetical protein
MKRVRDVEASAMARMIAKENGALNRQAGQKGHIW